jgi:hypothetical protein
MEIELSIKDLERAISTIAHTENPNDTNPKGILRGKDLEVSKGN